MAAAPSLSAVRSLAGVVLVGGGLVWGGANSLFNVEGGHRAIVFNRLVGIKDEVSRDCGGVCGVLR
jgi:prohibitin 2